MKIIFLDIDGVLNSAKYISQPGPKNTKYEFIDPDKLELLQYIVKCSDAKIVLSSTWKASFDDDLKPNSSLGIQLSECLKKFNLKLYDKTISLYTTRYDEIKEWLSRNKQRDKFIILDDLNIDWKELKANLVQTNYYIELTKKSAEYAVELLNKV